MKGYKAFNKDLTCRDMQYEIGKEYEMEEKPIPCKRGFHFCESLANCYNYYAMSEDIRICEVEATGDIETDDNIKYCTNKIRIIKEIDNPREKSNLSKTSFGFCNSGNKNTGSINSGDENSGDNNSGDRNTGHWNSGNYNSGNWNSGFGNSGIGNSGSWNSGSFNSGNNNSGLFNTCKHPKLKMFDMDSDWTMNDWCRSQASFVMNHYPCSGSFFVYALDMTEEEKESHPEYKTIGGYIKVYVATAEDKQKWWDSLSKEEKQAVYDLPNFDKEKFKECTGITVKEPQ